MQIHDTAFIAPGAVVQGDVTIGENSGIWKCTYLCRGSTRREKSTVLAEVLFCKLHVLYQFQRSQILLLLIPDGIISH